jgi:hypothetical protein
MVDRAEMDAIERDPIFGGGRDEGPKVAKAIPSRAELRDARRRQEDPAYGLMFPLTQPAEFAGVEVRVRLMSIADSAFLATLPTAVQRFVMECIADLSGQSARAQSRKDEPSGIKMVRHLKSRADVARAIIPFTWISPRVVQRVEDLPEVEDPDNPVWHIDDIHEDDLVRFYALVAGEDQAGAASLRPFLGSGESVRSDPVRSDLETSASDIGSAGGPGIRVVPGGGVGSGQGVRAVYPVSRSETGGDGQTDSTGGPAGATS